MASENLKFIKDKFKAAGFTESQTYEMLDLVDSGMDGDLLELINSSDKEGLGKILKETILPVMQREINQGIQEYPESAGRLLDKEGAFVKAVDGSEWNRDKFLNTLGRKKDENGIAHVGKLNDADYIQLRRNGLSKDEADSLAEKYRQEYLKAVADRENALMGDRIKNAAVQSLKESTDFDKDPLGYIVGNVVLPRTTTDLMNKAAKGEDIGVDAGVMGADLGEDVLMFQNPLARPVGAAAKAVGSVVKAISKAKNISNTAVKYGAKILGESATGAAADGALDAVAEGVAAASSDDYEFDPNKPAAVIGSSLTIPGLLGNATGVLGQFAGGNALARGVSKKMRRGEKTPTIQKLELETKSKWIDKEKKLAEGQQGLDKTVTERGAVKAEQELNERYPDYRKKGFYDADEYAKSLQGGVKDREITDSELALLGLKVREPKGVSELAGEALGTVIGPSSQIYFRGQSDDDRPDGSSEEYKNSEWYKRLNSNQKAVVDKAMKEKAKK